LLATSISSKINRREENCGRQDCGLTTSFVLLSKSTARREPTSFSSVSLPITRTEMPDP